MGFGIPSMLVGLAGVAIPVLIHLWNRRRYDIVDWGAMQFLRISATTRRRLLIEEILLLLLRMALIALLVVALAAPYADSSALARLGMKVDQDVILIFDGSSSMGYLGVGKTAHERARDWAAAFLKRLTAGDRVAILQAKQQVVPLLPELSHDLERARQAVADLPLPRGGCDWPQAVQEAVKILAANRSPQAEIILLTDGQRFGWADENSLLRWELLGKYCEEESIRPRIRVVNLDPQRPANPPNWSLAPVHASRAIASVGQQVTFRTALLVQGQEEYRKPHRIYLEIDERPVGDLEAPAAAPLEKGQVPLSFHYRFPASGSHLVSVIVEPDPPPEQRPPGYTVKDRLPGDNRQDLAIEVVAALPVLVVDGDSRRAVQSRSSDFLRDALDPARDPGPAVLVRVVSTTEFVPSLLTRNLGKEDDTKPRVLVLCNVARLLTEQQVAVAQFLASGGGVLVTLGDRVDGRHYNEQLYRGGAGWLPALLERIAGDESRPEAAVGPLPASFLHPALELFHEEAAGGLGAARFPRWWKVTVLHRDTASAAVALLSNSHPWLVERAYQKGRVILCTVPLDSSWGTNLTRLPAFAPLAHELVYYLAGARTTLHNFQPGQALLYRPTAAEALHALLLRPPQGNAKPWTSEPSAVKQGYPAQVLEQAEGPVVVYEDTREAGVYRVTAAGGRTAYYVAQPDPREADLSPCTAADREKVARFLPMTYEDGPEALPAIPTEDHPKQELWWLLFLGVIVLFFAEIGLTRRMGKGRG